MTTRRRNLLLLALVVVLSGLGLYFGTPKASPAGDALLSSVPRDAWLVATLDLDAIRASPLAAPVLDGSAAGDLLGVGKLQELCGFDPMARVHRLAIAVPEGGEKGDFGVAAGGDLATADFVSCAKKAIESRGGTAKTETRGAFALVEDAGGSGARIAIRDGGPLLVGRGGWLEAMMDATEGKAPRLSENAAQANVRALLASRASSANAAKRGPSIVVTAVLPSSMRDRLRQEMGGSPDGGTNTAMLGVLDVDTAGLAITAGAAGEDTDADLELHCATAEGCVAVKGFLEKERLTISQSFIVRMLGLGPVLDSLVVEAAGQGLSARAHAPTTTLASALDKALQFRRGGQKPAPAGAASGGAR